MSGASVRGQGLKRESGKDLGNTAMTAGGKNRINRFQMLRLTTVSENTQVKRYANIATALSLHKE